MQGRQLQDGAWSCSAKTLAGGVTPSLLWKPPRLVVGLCCPCCECVSSCLSSSMSAVMGPNGIKLLICALPCPPCCKASCIASIHAQGTRLTITVCNERAQYNPLMLFLGSMALRSAACSVQHHSTCVHIVVHEHAAWAWGTACSRATSLSHINMGHAHSHKASIWGMLFSWLDLYKRFPIRSPTFRV